MPGIWDSIRATPVPLLIRLLCGDLALLFGEGFRGNDPAERAHCGEFAHLSAYMPRTRPSCQVWRPHVFCTLAQTGATNVKGCCERSATYQQIQIHGTTTRSLNTWRNNGQAFLHSSVHRNIRECCFEEDSNVSPAQKLGRLPPAGDVIESVDPVRQSTVRRCTNIIFICKHLPLLELELVTQLCRSSAIENARSSVVTGSKPSFRALVLLLLSSTSIENAPPPQREAIRQLLRIATRIRASVTFAHGLTVKIRGGESIVVMVMKMQSI